MALAVGKLDAPRLLGEAPRGIAAATCRDGIFLYASAAVVGNGDVRGHLVHFVPRVVARIGVDADSRQVRHLIPNGILAFAFVAVELKLGNVTTYVARTYITDVAEAAGDGDIGIVHHSGRSSLGNEIQRYGIEEVGAVAAFEESQLDTGRLRHAWTPAHLRYDMGRTQIEAHPGAGAVHRGIEGVVIAVEGMGWRVDGRARAVCAVVDVGRTDGCACELLRVRSILGLAVKSCQQGQEKNSKL